MTNHERFRLETLNGDKSTLPRLKATKGEERRGVEARRLITVEWMTTSMIRRQSYQPGAYNSHGIQEPFDRWLVVA